MPLFCPSLLKRKCRHTTESSAVKSLKPCFLQIGAMVRAEGRKGEHLRAGLVLSPHGQKVGRGQGLQ